MEEEQSLYTEEEQELRDIITKNLGTSIDLNDSNDRGLVDYLVEVYNGTEFGDVEEAREGAESFLKASLPNLKQIKIENLLDELTDYVKEQKDPEKLAQKAEEEHELERLESLERDGTCKLCGGCQKITIHHTIPKLVLKRLRNKVKD
eukprot:TRINITY_DN11544_c0_g1_i2.p1 TRINITY_DN11544_c0_g1~~TRINITY_DN11544_c0_g1_i2.p1  ORF type:complete len:164 (+),score=56.76 TRINITY_DN11544_c0_g1_i2:49-492(+)